MAPDGKKLVLWFKELGMGDVAIVGGKNASLGEMYQTLTGKGVRIPNGYAVTAHAYRYLLDSNNAHERLHAILDGLDVKNVDALRMAGHKSRALLRSLEFPADLVAEIKAAYATMCDEYGQSTDVAVRSSATAEDLPDASFAGQQETYLNVHGVDQLLVSCSNCFASLFTDRAIAYRVEKGFDHFAVALSIGVQKMIRSDLAASGVMFSIDTESGFEDAVYITGAYGLGENVVQGTVNPDEFYVHKPTLLKGFKPLVSKQCGEKEYAMVYDTGGNKMTKQRKVAEADRERFCITDEQALALARWACTIEDHYSAFHGRKCPMDMEWALDGITGELYIVQARPETVHSQRERNTYSTFHIAPDATANLEMLTHGKSVGKKIATGKAMVINSAKDMRKFTKGCVLVTEITDPDWVPIMKQAAAIVTNSGGRTCHAAIISRELGIPCIVGCVDATEVIPEGREVSIDCHGGENGIVWNGVLPYEIRTTKLDTLPKLPVDIMQIVGTPDTAFEVGQIPSAGVGLVRMEFICLAIGIHPLLLVNYERDVAKLSDVERFQVESLTHLYGDKKAYFVDNLARGVGRIAAAFYPKPVVVRMSDFKTNEYRELLGGRLYEGEEENPMIGWRGASRYYSEYEPGFALECEAMLRVRNVFGLDNVVLMVPFCRTVSEGKKVLATMAKYGLKQGEKGLKVYAMCEIPANVILAEEFLDVFDGYSIGSNDLTQLTLGLDRDNGKLASMGIADERNEAVLQSIGKVIRVAKAKGKYIGLCGQAASDHPAVAEFLMREGIDSMALTPDSVIETIQRLGALVDKDGNLTGKKRAAAAPAAAKKKKSKK